jgi:hypothetical protein
MLFSITIFSEQDWRDTLERMQMREPSVFKLCLSEREHADSEEELDNGTSVVQLAQAACYHGWV